MATQVQEETFDLLDAPIRRVCLDDIPLPYSTGLEVRAQPDAPRVAAVVGAAPGQEEG